MSEAARTTTDEPAFACNDPKQLDLAVGGQAVIEGVMMRSPTAIATAVRTPDGGIVIRKRPFRSIIKRFGFLNIPVLRGGIHLIESMSLGIGALMFSADQALSDERVEAGGKKLKDTLLMWGMIVLAFALSMGLFFYLPLILTDLFPIESSIWFNVVDGFFRVLLFSAYLFAISKMPDMARVFEYHGAEHKSIHTFEAKLDLLPKLAKTFSPLHPRCGTSFLFFVMAISLVVFVFLGKPHSVPTRLLRLAFVPLIGGLAYEVIKISGRFAASNWIKPLIWPGLMLQKITTSEPDEPQLEVALSALKAVLAPEADNFQERVYYEMDSRPDAPSAEAK